MKSILRKGLKMRLGRRKIQKTKYTYTLALPPFWIRDKGLEKGDQVEIEINRAGNLVLKPPAGGPGK